MAFENKYDAKLREEQIRKFWETEQIYKFDKKTTKPIFSIDTPPPTISGRMHIGHAYSYSQQDFVARYKRMSGHEVYFPFGTDDNGLPTEKLVQKDKKVDLRKVDRKKAVEIVLEYLEEERPKFIQDWKDLGMSCDFDLRYSTIDKFSQKISQESFLDLVEKGLIERRKGPVMWDRQFQTAIAQAELEDVTRKAYLNYVKAKVVGTENTFMIYATTRPELCFAVVGMSVEDSGDYVKLQVGNEYWITGKTTYEEKFKEFKFKIVEELKGENLIGEKVKIPVCEKEVIVSHDTCVKADFGTGIAYFCTYGGLEDIEWASRHKASPVELLNTYGKLTKLGGKYEGLLAEDARKQIISDMELSGELIKKEQKEQVVNVGERSGVEVEFIVSNQWYVKYLDKKEYFWEMAEKFNWTPDFMKSRIENWIRGLNWDWGVSRQRHFGIPIPAWICKNCSKIHYPTKEMLPIDPVLDKLHTSKCSCGSTELIGETDVFDTWFTSASSAVIASKLVDKQTKIKAIVFDVDGVLIDSMNMKSKYFNELLTKLGVEKEKVLDLLTAGQNRIITLQKIKERFNLKFDVKKAVEELTEIYIQNYSKVEKIDSTINFIKNNHEKYLFFTNTSLPEKDLKIIFEIKNLHNYFKELYHFESGTKLENINMILKKYHLKPEEVLFIDDNINHINNVKSSGVNTCFFDNNNLNIAKEVQELENSNSKLFNKIFPMTLRPQGHDIINFWLFYSMAKNNLQYGINPFRDVNISGWVLAADGTKMSKSKGNTIAPQDVVSKFSNDAIRFAAGSTKLGSDIPYQEKEVKTGLAVANKLYNANKFASMLLENFSRAEISSSEYNKLRSIDRYIIARLHETIENATKAFEVYDYAKAKSEFEQFFMTEIADNYIEIVKNRLWKPEVAGLEETKKAQIALYEVLYNSLKGLAPFMPYITEEVYQNFYKQFEEEKSVHLSSWPKANKKLIDENLILTGNGFLAVVSASRKYKSEKQVSQKTEISELKIDCSKEVREFIENSMFDMKAVTGAHKITFSKDCDIVTENNEVRISAKLILEEKKI